MKKYTIYLFAVLILSSCEEGVIEDFTNTEIEPGTEIEGAFFSGQIHSNGIPIPEASVFVYQGGELIGETFSDTNGEYNTLDFSLDVGPDVTFEIIAESYSQKVRRSSSIDQVYQDYNHNMILSSLSAIDSGIEFPGDTTLIKVFGTFTDENGEPIFGARCNTSWDLVEIIPGQRWQTQGNLESTDENGYFEMLVAPEKEIFFQSKFYAIDCNFPVTDGDVLPGLPPSILWDSFLPLGQLTEDTEIIERSDITSGLFKSNIQGRFLNCDGTPATNGSIEFVNNFTLPTQVGPAIRFGVLDAQGNFQQSMDFCNSLEELWTVATFTTPNGFSYSTEIEMTDGGIFPITTVEACIENNTKYGTMSLQVGNLWSFEDYQIFKTNEDTEVGSFAGVPVMFIGQAKIVIPNIQLGDNIIQEFRMSDGDTWGFHSTDGELTATIESIDDGFAKGNFSGNTVTVNGVEFSLTGEFNLPL